MSSTYEALDLNFGLKQTFFSPSTPFAFRDRIFGLNGLAESSTSGLKDLFQVLSKWSKAVYIPPKSEQSFQQGGAFIFKGDETLFAHYDASTGAHVDPEMAVKKAVEISDIAVSS